MTTRESKLVFSEAGASGVRARVVSLTEALEGQKRRHAELQQILPKTGASLGVVEAASQSAAAKITSLTNTIGPVGAALGAVTRSVNPAAQGLIAYASAAEKVSLANRLMNSVLIGGTTTMLAAGAVATAYADDILRASDTYSTLTARIRTFSEGQIAAAQTERALYEAARESRTGVGDLTTLYTRLTPALRDFGRSQEDALTVTQLTSKALAIQGADVREQAAATIQFSQAIASGVLRGDELRSLLESSPQLMRYIAQNLEINGKVGVAFSALRKLGEEGALTGERVVSAMLRAEALINKDFGTAPKTAQQGWIVLKDEITRTIGSLDKMVGGQKAVVAWLGEMTDKAEAFRQKLLSDPAALDGLKQAQDFVGDAVSSIGALGKVAVENFDLLVSAGQAVLALKLGSVLASWFAQAATASKAAIANVQAFQQAARFNAGAVQNPVIAEAARNARAAATAADARAADLIARAELKAAEALAARRASEQALLQAQLARRSVGAGSVAAAEAEAAASAQVAVAKRAEAAAKVAATSATNASTIASTRNAVAQEAEALATANVTSGQIAKTGVMRVVTGAYNLLGGGIGVATLALGGLLFALMKSEEAFQQQVAAQRDAMVVGDRLRAITDQMTTSTYSRIQSLEIETQTLLANAAAEREKAKALVERKEAEIRAAPGFAGQVTGGYSAGVVAAQIARTRKEIDAAKANIAASNAETWRNSQEQIKQDLAKSVVKTREIQQQLNSGKDLAGRALTDQQRAALTSDLTGLFKKGQDAVDQWQARMNRQQGVVQSAKGGAKAGANEVLGIYSGILDVAAELVSAAGQSSGTPPAPKTPKPKAVVVPGGVSAAYTDLLRAGFLQLDGGRGYSVDDGQVSRGGQAVTARSEDEAAALTRYVKIVESLNDATDAQIKKEAEKLGVTARSKDELKLAAGAILDQELATSKASRAEERWLDIKAEMSGESRALIKAENDLQQLIRDGGVTAMDPMIERYKAWIKLQDQAARAAEALQAAQAPVQRGFEDALATQPAAVTPQGLVDPTAAIKQVEDAKARVALDRTRIVEDEIARLKRASGGRLADEEKLRARLMQGFDIALEVETQDRILEIKRQALRDDAQALEQHAAQTADTLVGALRDISFGGDIKDVGKRLGMDILSALYDELIGNPLRFAIQSAIRNLVQSNGGGGGSFWKTLLNVGASFVTGGANLSSTVSATIAANPNLFADGRVPKFANGRNPWMDGPFVRGPGTPRSDRTPAWVSPDEAIINALSSQRYQRELRAINDGTFDPYADLRRLQDRTGLGGPGRYADGYNPSYGATAPVYRAPVAAAAGPGELHVHNHGEPMKITARRDERGATHIDMKPLADSVVRSAAHSGALGRAQREQRQPKLRG